MITGVKVVILLVALLLAQIICCGQDAKPLEASEAIFRATSSLIELHATVKDANGKLLKNAPESAFQILENNIQQKILVFRQEDSPVSLGLIIDNSESMGPKRAQTSAAALTLVRSSNPEDEVFLINFSENPTLACEFTKDVTTLEAALKTVNSSGPTAMRDALSMGIEHLKQGAKNERKVLLVVTDGQDNSSHLEESKLIRRAQESGVLIYSVGLLADTDTRERARAKKTWTQSLSPRAGKSFTRRLSTRLKRLPATSRAI